MIYPPRKMAPGERLTAANYNALLDYVKRITPRPGANVKVDYRLGGAVISGTPGGARTDPLAPFTCRYHDVEEGDAQWEIYLPDGCVNVGGTCAPINPAASESGGDHEDDQHGWYLLGLDEDSGTTGTDEDGNTYREWWVSVHAKTSAKMYGVDDLNAPARRLVWVGVRDRLKPPSSITDAERYKDIPGDSFSCDVARVRVTTVSDGGETETVRKVTQLRKNPVDIADSDLAIGNFGLVWYFSVSDGELSVENVYCVVQELAAAGISITGDSMTDVLDASTVYVRIDATDMSDGSGIAEVLKDPGGTTGSTAHVLWLKLYDMKHNTVTADHRAQSLSNVQLFHA